MRFPPFAHARYLGEAWQHGVPRHNLGASAFAPADPLQWLPREILAQDVAHFDLHAATAFRDAVARHLGLPNDHVRPVAGTSAGNTAVIASLVDPGDGVVCERPHYTPLASLATGFGADVTFVDHDLDVDQLIAAIGPATSLVLLTSPNNPTGRALAASDLERIAAAADEHDAYVLVDQVYRELTDHALAAGQPRLISTGSLNKCWGAPGLRAGWVAGDPDVMERIEETHRIMNLGPSAAGTRLATALLPHAAERRAELEARLQDNHIVYEGWAEENGLEPDHGDLIAFPRLPVDDTRTWADSLLPDGILVLPGEMFDRPGHIRIGLGVPTQALEEALSALAPHLATTTL